MEFAVGAKSTKPGSKATAKRSALAANGKPPRVPVGVLHVVDMAAQTNSAMYDAVCGETGLVIIDNEWNDDLANERCVACNDHHWMATFGEMQNELLK